MQTRNVILGLATLAICQFGLAESKEPSKTQYRTNSWYVSLGEISFDSEVASQEGVKDTATYFRAAWEGQSNAILYAVGLSGYFYSDRQSFSQTVEDSSGSISTERSSAEAVNLYFEGGYSHSLSKNLSAEILGGYELVLQSERSISYCSNCSSSDIDIDGGLYTTPRIKFTADNGFTLALSYHVYLSGDVENAASISLGWSY